MKRKLLTLCCTTALCLSLISCGLKNAITGTNSPDTTTTDDSLTATENNEQTSESEGDITNDESTDTNSESSTDSVLANNDFVDNSNSTSTDSSNNASTSSLVTTTNSANSSTRSRDCRIFYYNKVDSKTYCTDTKASVTDNAFVTALTDKLYEAPNNNNNFITLSKDYGVKSATLDYSTNVLTVVFNSNFLDEMKLDDTASKGLMSAIVNTYGYNYQVNKVAVYFGNDLYTGLDGTAEAGYSTVDYTNTLKLD